MKIKRQSNRFLLAFLSLGIVSGAVAGSALMAAPQAQAESGVIINTNAETEVQLNLLPVISVAAEDININVTPNDYASGTSHIIVDSNAANSYSVYFSTATSDKSLNNQYTNDHRINSVADDIALEDFQTDTYQNQWGFVHTVGEVETISPVPFLGEGNTRFLQDCDSEMTAEEYAACATSNYALANGTDDPEATPEEIADKKAVYDSALLCSGDFESSNSDSCDLEIGVKIDNTLPSGVYSNVIVITAVANLGS